MRIVDSAQLVPGQGIAGDHFRPKRGSLREVTIIQFEHLSHIAAALEHAAIPPELLRRNLVISGIAIAALQGETFRVGAAMLRGTGACAPCARMDEALGPLGRKAISGRGGITAVIVQGGEIRVGDRVERHGANDDTTPCSCPS
jgi:MOSC domain-containing protein YiiM